MASRAYVVIQQLLMLLLQLNLSSATIRRELIKEVGPAAWAVVTRPCDPAVMGMPCSDPFPFVNGDPFVTDFPLDAPEVALPADPHAPWGIHLTGPWPDGVSYLISWTTGRAIVGPASTLPSRDASSAPAYVRLSAKPGKLPAVYATSVPGSVITYTRINTVPYADHSYLSPNISHCLCKLKPATKYYYVVGDGLTWSSERSFKTLPNRPTFPIRVGVFGDLGQTHNASVTLQHMAAHLPDVVLHVGDLSYADLYQPNDTATTLTVYKLGSNHIRWDTSAQLYQDLNSRVPMMTSPGNHEIECENIECNINSTTTSFSYPHNYPFQAWSARYPVPGKTSKWGTINDNLYFSTTMAGSVRIITLNNYVPFHIGTPQHTWAMKAFKSVDRSKTPWLIVMLHGAPYHTSFRHFKSNECFMHIYEDLFYASGVDVVLSGHVHSYERTHGVYKYTRDKCGPVYVTIGDGGNAEGPTRSHVDEAIGNKTFCDITLSRDGSTPNALYAAGNSGWGDQPYGTRVVPPGCPTTSWQPASGVKGGPPLVLFTNNGTSSNNASQPHLGFCQSSQPNWSAFRDPSFGHAIMDILSPSKLRWSWYRNQDGAAVVAESVVLSRQSGCKNSNASGRRRH